MAWRKSAFVLAAFLLSASDAWSATLSRTAVSFGPGTVGTTSSPQTVTVTNESGARAAIQIGSTGDFSQTHNCGTALEAGQSCVVSTRFTPTRSGSRTGTLFISDPQGVTQVALTGTGITLALSASSFSFGSWPVGWSSQTKTLTLTNKAASQISFTRLAASPTDFVRYNDCGWDLYGYDSCEIQLQFVPKASGPRTGTLTIEMDYPVVATLVVTLEGTGNTARLVSVAVNPTAPTAVVGSRVQFKGLGTFSDGAVLDVTSDLLWRSANIVVGSIGSSNGLAKAFLPGTTTITARDPDTTIKGSTTLTVATTAPTLVSLAITPLVSTSLLVGAQQQFAATGTWSDGRASDLTATSTWTSSNTAVVSVGSTGLATTQGAGVATVTATSHGVKASLPITVLAPATLVSVAVTPQNPLLTLNGQQQFVATGTYSDGQVRDLTSSCAWTSSSPDAVSVGGTTGLASGVASGSSTVTANSGGIQGSTTVTVSPSAPTLVSLSISPERTTFGAGEQQQYLALGLYSDGQTRDVTDRSTWTSTDPSIVSIGATGLASALGAGTTTITAALPAEGGQASISVTVAPPTVVLVSLAVTPTAAMLVAGDLQQYAAIGTYSDGTTADLTTQCTWTSSATTVLDIGNTTGLATSVSAGTADVVATAPGGTIQGAATATVTPAPTTLLVIAVTPTSPALVRGGTQQLTATGTWSDGTTTDVTATSNWSTSDAAVASIDLTGLVTAQGGGTATITAATGTLSGTATVTVAPHIVSIEVTPASVSLGLNAQQQYTARATYNDLSVKDVTTQVAWTSGVPATVSIEPTGLATVLATATTAIPLTATMDGVASPPSWLSALASLPAVCREPSLDMKILVVTNSAANGGAGYATFPAIKQILEFVGTPYTVVETTSATAPALSDGNCHGYFQGVIFAFGGDIYTVPWMAELTAYEKKFSVRQANWFMYPTPDFGFNQYTSTVSANEKLPAHLTADGASIFSYANPEAVIDIENAFVYLGTPLSGSAAKPLLVDAAGNALALVYDFGDGRQYLTQTFDSNQYLLHNHMTAYGILNWVTKGIFLGEYKIYAWAQVDDFFLNSSRWVPGTPCTNPITHDRTPPDWVDLPTVRTTLGDMVALVAWQSSIQRNPLLADFKLQLAMNGIGTTGNPDWTGLPKAGVANDDLISGLRQYEHHFHWMSHTWDHPETLNGLHKSDPFGDPDVPQVDSIDLEILTNLYVATGLGVNLNLDPSNESVVPLYLTDFSPSSIVTPGVTGLDDPNVSKYMYQNGIRFAVSDTSVLTKANNGPNPSPNVGYPNTFEPGLYLVPRYPNNVFFNAATWEDDAAEFACLNPPPSVYAGYTGPQILDYTTDVFVQNMLKGDMNPQMFHQANLIAYDGTHSLISDVYQQTFDKYLALYRLPVLSPTLDEGGRAMEARNAYNLSKATGTIVGVGTANATIRIQTTGSAAVVPVTGLRSTGSENYGGTDISHLTMTGGATVTLPLQ